VCFDPACEQAPLSCFAVSSRPSEFSPTLARLQKDAMEILYLLIPLSMVLVLAVGFAFWWASKSGQFEDMEGPAYRVVMDDDTPHVEKPTGHTEQPLPRRY
jgi:cbb3-type cytochrome oxidase maturation protein